MRGKPDVFIALGSNQGDSIELVLAAIDRLQALSEKPLVRSSLWRTAPVGCPEDSPPFINAVVGIWPHPLEQPESLLIQLQGIENSFGRQRSGIANAPRTLDLDLIVFGNETRSTPALTLPHPRAVSRRFVVAPLCEIAPDLVIPGQTQTMLQLHAALLHLDNQQSIEKIEVL